MKITLSLLFTICLFISALCLVVFLPHRCISQDLRKLRLQYSLQELRESANAVESYDFGLTAELLTAHWLVEHGLKPDGAVDYFLASVKARTECDIPDWWRTRFTDEFLGNETAVSAYAANDSSSFGSYKYGVAKFGDRLLRLPESFKPHETIFGTSKGDYQFMACASSTGGLSDLAIGSFEKASNDQVKSLKQVDYLWMDEWCPLMVGMQLDDNLKDECRPGTLEFNQHGNNLVIFGDTANRLFISVVDLTKKKHKFSFVVVERWEKPTIGCSLDEMRKRDRPFGSVRKD